MDEDDLDQLLADLEEDVAAEVSAVLTEVADEYARGLNQATEIVAARFSVTSITRAWRQRVPRLMRRLLRVSETAATTAANDTGTALPDGWNDLPQRYDNNTLPPQLGSYVAETETLLRSVGGRLANTATRELAEGLNSGETIDQLRARLLAAFDRDGTQLGDAREQRIAATECLPADTIVTAGRITSAHRRFYDGEWVTVRLRSGNELSGTPNHPVLTQRGWVGLGELTEHDSVVSRRPQIDGATLADPYVEDAPPTIGEIFDALNAVGVTERVEGASPDFHGDGTDGYVDVASPRGALMVGDFAAVNERALDGVLVGPDAKHVALDAFRSPFRRFLAVDEGHSLAGAPYPDSGLLEDSGDKTLTDVKLAHEALERASKLVLLADVLGGQVGAQPRVFGVVELEGRGGGTGSGNTRLLHDPADGGSLNATNLPGHGRGALPGEIELDDVVSLVRGNWSGHVYNLSTVDGYFTASQGSLYTGNTTRAWNAATLGAAKALTGPDRPLVKQWVTRHDSRVRRAHRDANAQLRFLDDAFTVGGSPMQYPGDPSAPADLTIQCRCVLRLATADRTAAATPAEETPMDAVTAAADGEHTSGMIALIPTEGDAERLALDGDGAEPANELHLTLWFLGDAAPWTDDQRNELIDLVRARAATLPAPIRAHAFGINHWNPGSEDPAWVWAVGDDRDADDDAATLHEARNVLAVDALESTHERPETPHQHSPWVAHTTGAYSTDPWPLEPMAERLGPITFDRVRIAFGGNHTDIPLGQNLEAAAMDEDETMPDEDWTPPVRGWTTPGDTALAFENQETGDGRIFAAGALHWDGSGPWPLQYAEEMLSGHDGAELAGAIANLDRVQYRIPADGLLYLTTRAGWEAEQLLEQGAPLGVSVDLDDVEVEFIDRTGNADDEPAEPVTASLASASVLRLDDGSWIIRGHTPGEWTASGVGLARNARTVEWITAPGSTLVSAATVRDAFPHLTAAAGDPDQPEQGTLVHSESAGDVLMRIVRARVRGATLVSVPAFADARIVLEPREQQTPADEPYALAAAAHSARERVITYVRTSVIPVTARDITDLFTDMDITAVRRHLAAGVESGHLVRIARGMYVAATDLNRDLAAAVTGATGLPIADRDMEWDGPGAQRRVFEWATGEDGTVDTGKVGQAFLWIDPDGDPQTQAAWKLGFADLIDGELRIIPRGVFAVAAVLEGARGGADIPADDQDAIRDKVTTLYRKIAEELDDPGIVAPWDQDDDMSELEASAWRAMRELPPMPAEFFADPVAEGLLTDTSPGVNYSGGRVYGWVAKKGVPHAGYPGKNLTIEKLMREGMDFSNFLRQRFTLDDGSEVRVGPMTADVGHHRDGAQCETAACQFDNSGTTAGVVTVGYAEGHGLWFSGAAAPWLSDWDRSVFMACSPSYHLSKARKGWDFRAVLSVPVPGHPTPLVAAIASVVERSNLAITAAAALAEPETVAEPEPQHDRTEDEAPTATVEALTAALLSPAFLDRFTDALRDREEQRTAELAALTADINSIKDEITASAAPTEEES